MKFVCGGCGKKYATSEDPSPGKVYKVKCKACGHLIVVKSAPGTGTAIPVLSQGELTPDPGPGPRAPAPLPPEVASAIDGAAPQPATTPPPDELADLAAAAADVMAEPADGTAAGQQAGYVDLFADKSGERVAGSEALAAAARASLPPGYAGADPLAPRKLDTPRPSRVEPHRSPAAPPARPPPAKGLSPLHVIALGVVLILAITAATVWRGARRSEPPAGPAVRPPATAAAPAAAAPDAAPAPEPAGPPASGPQAEPSAAPRTEQAGPPAKGTPAEKRPEARTDHKARPERKAEVKADKVAAAPAPAQAQAPEPAGGQAEPREVPLQDAEATLTPEVVQRVIAANRRAFSSCITAAGPDVSLDGRPVALKLTVSASGAVSYPTLDDATLNSTAMGQCLKTAARLMIFPRFRGDPAHVEVPLTLSN